MRIARSFCLAALLLVPAAATAEERRPTAGAVAPAAAEELTADVIVARHLAASGGAKLRTGTSLTFTVTGEKMGKKFTKTVVHVRPNRLRVDIKSDDGPFTKAYDGKVAWMKKGDARAEKMSPEDTASMALHAVFEEQLLDYAKKGIKVRLVGHADVMGSRAHDLEVTLKNGDVEHQFIDASSYLLVQKTFTGKDKDGKPTLMTVRFGDYQDIQGRMVNSWVEWDGDDGKSYRSIVSAVAWDKKYDPKLFRMPK